ncbi:MAG: decarboxylating 6-phosphogluconate dehydrogenase [Deltaproteobacteria bacterium]|nr:decarboxylating 6-phosphogluconate dehydrogenase [Deltaproteobacteria bacterium]
MQIGMIGLGRMGMNMAKRLLRGGHSVVAYNRASSKTDQVVFDGAIGAYSLDELFNKLSTPRIVWIMLPAGPVVDEHIEQIREKLLPGDIVIDGGNTYYEDDIRRAKLLRKSEINYMDVGVSGGVWGLEEGYCLMAGGDKEIFQYLEPIFKTLAPEEGYLYCGPIGAGHFVKMVHNGIEYGMMQAYGEGFDILEASPYAKSLNFAELSHLWNQGSVVRSWLLELAEAAFGKDEKLSGIKGYIEDSGEGRWTVQQAINSGVAAPVIAISLMRRFRSQEQESFSDRVVAALRREFGGHRVVKDD